MSSRVDFFFKQKVTEAELDLAFALLERADRALAADIGIHGIIGGGVPTPHEPLPDLSVDLTAPCHAYDNLGQRIYFGTGQTIDCSADHAGLPTEVPLAGEARWLGVFLRFARQLSDPRTDGNSQQVFFRRDESFELIVRQGPTAAAGTAPKVALQADELLLCDVLRTHGQDQVLEGDIDVSRRQAFVFTEADAVEVEGAAWGVLQPIINTVQAALDEVDTELGEHFDGAARRHAAGDVDYTPHGFIGSATVQAALNELLDALSSAVVGEAGASHVGTAAVVGVPHALPAGHTEGQITQLLTWLNTHLSSPAAAHNASAIAAQAHAYIAGLSVQAQLQEMVASLQSQAAGLGAEQVGDAVITDAPNSLVAGSVRAQLIELLAHLNAHTGSTDHDGRYFTEAESDARYYNVGEQVADADTIDGLHADAFATAGHDHDSRYIRRTYLTQVLIEPGAIEAITTLADGPDLVTVSYNYPDAETGLPMSTTYIRGDLATDLHYWVSKTDMGGGDKDYLITVHNKSAVQLWVNVAAYRRD